MGKHQQRRKADKLADDGRQRGTRHAEIQRKDEQRVQRNVQHRAQRNADHRQRGTALKPQLVVQHKGAHNERCADENPTQILHGVGQDGVGGAEQAGNRRDKHHAQHRQHAAAEHRREKGGGCHTFGIVVLTRAELAGNIVARAVTEEKADGLQQRHRRVGDADGGGGLRVELPDKGGIDHIVQAGDQHTDHGGQRKL